MSAIIDEVATFLFDEEFGTAGTDVFVGYVPDDIDDSTSVIDTGGLAPETDVPLYHPTFQVFIKASTFVIGSNKLDQVRSLLHRLTNRQLISGGTYFYYILAQSHGGPIGRDESGRYLFSINFHAHTR